MKPRERQEWIAETIGREGQVSVDDLAARFAVSAETIRRDLGLLDDMGVIKKIHGGATRLRMRVEGSFDERMAENIDGKRAIAAKLVGMIEPGTIVFIDTGTTTFVCAEALAATRRLTVITNSSRIAGVVASGAQRNDVFLLGGAFNPRNTETLGPMTIEQVHGFQADYALISPAAIDAETGLMDADFGEASVAKAMISRATQLVVAADHSKMGKRAAFAVAGLDAIDALVCDQAPRGVLRETLDSFRVEIW